MRQIIRLALAIAVLSASGVTNASDLGRLPAGVWRTDGYGYIFETDGKKLTIFDETKAACIFDIQLDGREADDYIAAAELNEGGSQALLHAGISRIAVARLPNLPQRCKLRPSDPDPLLNFDILWETFDEHYAFFAERKIDWKTMRADFRPKAAAARSPDELFDVMSAMLAPLKDAHVQLTAGEKEFQAERSPAPTNPDADGLISTRKALQKALKNYITSPSTPLLSPAAGAGRNRIWYGRLAPDIGYIAVFAMGGFEDDDVNSDDNAASARKTFQEIATKLAGVSGVVVDLRYNQGGHDPVSLALAGLFAEHPGIAFKKSARGAAMKPYAVMLNPSAPARLVVPVAVLISAHTVSAGESAATAFRTLSNAKLIGQPTQGALSDTLSKTLPNGWTFTLSNEVFTNEDGASPEVVGVQPHIATPLPKPTSSSARFHPDIDEAVRWLKTTIRKN